MKWKLCLFNEAFYFHLKDKVSPPEVSYGSRKPSSAPDESEEQTPLCEAELLHHLPEPSDQGGGALDAL